MTCVEESETLAPWLRASVPSCEDEVKRLPDAVPGDAASTTTVSISGRFLERGLEADVRVQVDRAGTAQDCEYNVRWTWTKQGSPNRLA